MFIETDRLYLIPLTAQQLKLWIEDIPLLEKELNCVYCAEPMEELFLEIVKGQLEKTEEDESNYLYHSFWFLVRKSDRIVVGSADFKDIPDVNHEVEIGYGLGKGFEHNGYMTEAVRAMCNWVMAQENVAHVIAETEIDSPQSQNILKCCGFVRYKQDESIWWRL
ncbi:MAG: GNAT family N-acetyltransferase [Clostridiales bacterium]|jgi:RimJ/RimL family protein N-acetyltransferase|nr:GNAT family N-acetyltransferase [Clostridiales bacterium]